MSGVEGRGREASTGRGIGLGLGLGEEKLRHIFRMFGEGQFVVLGVVGSVGRKGWMGRPRDESAPPPSYSFSLSALRCSEMYLASFPGPTCLLELASTRELQLAVTTSLAASARHHHTSRYLAS